ncbi:MAG TPA: enoyl-CoA hydratase-related protein [Acidimicrobiia bacterium]|nr:enoyl-CoA hydratase-related protein [Acidimicrobiia bacterium]
MWLLTEDRGELRWLTINRPERRNAIPGHGWASLEEAFREFEASRQRVLVLTGAGGSFCSGADLDPAEAGSLAGVARRHRRMKQVGAAASSLYRITKPTIAAVDGVAAGAGMNLALGCDLVIGSTRARFSEIFVRRGLTVDFGGTWLLPRVVGIQRAKELALSGRIVEAEEALQLGLVLELVGSDELDGRVTELAESLLGGAPIGQMFAKHAINRAFSISLEEALAWEGQSQSICFATEDVNEGISAFLEKRAAKFRGR